MMAGDKRPRVMSMLVISGDAFDPSDITASLDVEPTIITIKGRKRPGNRPPEPATEWVLETGWKQLASTEESVSELLKRVWPLRSKIRKLTAQHKLRLKVVTSLESVSCRPVYELSADNILQLGRLGASYAIDM